MGDEVTKHKQKPVILLDAVKGIETTYEALVERFGREGASVVVEVTDDKALPNFRCKQFQGEYAPQLWAAIATAHAPRPSFL